ncbi:hypothetical protein MRX96_002091 [Rhipicephalus microplus]
MGNLKQAKKQLLGPGRTKIATTINSLDILPSLLEVTASTIKRCRMVLGQATARKFQRCQESIDKDSSAYSLRPL